MNFKPECVPLPAQITCGLPVAQLCGFCCCLNCLCRTPVSPLQISSLHFWAPLFSPPAVLPTFSLPISFTHTVTLTRRPSLSWGRRPQPCPPRGVLQLSHGSFPQQDDPRLCARLPSPRSFLPPLHPSCSFSPHPCPSLLVLRHFLYSTPNQRAGSWIPLPSCDNNTQRHCLFSSC